MMPASPTMVTGSMAVLWRSAEQAATRGAWDEALSSYTQLLQHNDTPAARLAFAEYLGAREQYGGALRMGLAALELWQAQGDLQGAAQACGLLARVYRRTGDLESAAGFQRRALAWGADFDEAVLLELAIDAVAREDYDVAAELIRSAIEGASESNDMELLGNALGMLANVELLAGGEPAAALQLVCDAQRCHRQIGDVAGRVADWLTAAAAWAALGRTSSELRACARAEQLLRESGLTSPLSQLTAQRAWFQERTACRQLPANRN